MQLKQNHVYNVLQLNFEGEKKNETATVMSYLNAVLTHIYIFTLSQCYFFAMIKFHEI